MSPEASRLLEAALALPEAERVDLADAIWETIGDDFQRPLSPEWRAEIARRMQESDAGVGEPLSEEEVDRRLRAKFGFGLFDES